MRHRTCATMMVLGSPISIRTATLAREMNILTEDIRSTQDSHIGTRFQKPQHGVSSLAKALGQRILDGVGAGA